MTSLRRAALLAMLLPFSAAVAIAAEGGAPKKQVAITIDDLPLNGPPLPLEQVEYVNRTLISELEAARIPGIGFVNEKKLYSPGEIDARVALLRLWLDKGFDLGNHTFSHLDLNATPVPAYEADIVRGEAVTSKLLAAKNRKLEYFRYPYLSVGSTPETKAAVEAFLKDRGYRIAPVSVDGWDWMFSAVYTKAKLRGDKDTMARVIDAYLTHLRAAFAYSEKKAFKSLGRPMRQILLMHCNSMNADHLDEIVRTIRDAGYEFVSLDAALQDPAYARSDDPSGMGDPDFPMPPQFVQDLYKDAHYAD